MIHTIPYKPLSRCGLDELAAEQAMRDRWQRIYGGVAFARKDDDEEKRVARRAIAEMLSLEAEPGCVSILTMPGLGWHFEAKLLKAREPNWRNQQMTTSMRLTCVENDRFIYYSATTRMPGKHTLMRSLERPEYAERVMGNGIIDRYEFANVDDVMQSDETFDYAWLDYTGPLSVPRMKVIKDFWVNRVRKALVVTSLKARWSRETSDHIKRKGGVLPWLRESLPGQVAHEMEYQDGASPMVQFAVSKSTPSPA